jgi:hypothetical protein
MCALAPAFVAACGGSDDALSSAAGGVRYEVSTMVLESATHGPSLCLGSVAQSYPPQCGRVPVTNWRWDRVEGEERAGGTTWVEAHVVGTYADGSFTLTERPGPQVERVYEPFDSSPACAVPEVVSGASVYRSEWHPDGLFVESRSLAGIWVSPGGIMSVLAVRGSGPAVAVKVRGFYDGPLCVVEVDRLPTARLREIQAQVPTELPGVLAAGVDERRGLVTVDLVLASPDLLRRMDERYGPGVVELVGALTPVG